MPKFRIAALALASATSLSVPALAAAPVTFKAIYNFLGNVSGFSKDGAYPESALVMLGTTLYGASVDGGKYGNGTLFAYDLASGTEKTVYNIDVDTNSDAGRRNAKAPARYPGQEPVWIGTAARKFVYVDYNQQLLRYKTTGKKSRCLFGSSEYENVNAALAMQVGDTLITNETSTDTQGPGALVAVDRQACTITTLYTFTGGKDGGNPNGPLAYVNGLVYGSAETGGASGNGVIFKYDPMSGTFNVIYTFKGGKDGTNPNGVLYANGLLYGTANSGGANGQGTVFSIDPATGAETTLHDFMGSADGTRPSAPLIAVGGFLYGTAMSGGEDNDGTIFKVDMSSGRETTLHSFLFTDGSLPLAALTHYNGVFYGTTVFGGTVNEGSPNGAGVIFQFTE